MIRDILKSTEYFVIKWYATLHLQQQRVIKLYKIGGITQSIANKELRSIYKQMRLTRSFDNLIIRLMAKAQTLSLDS
ncbi:MAG: hypothetical protein OCD02_10700 [Spirochaetaceae bacterium]